MSEGRRNVRTTARSLTEDDSGAIMVIGVFMAALVTGFLYYIVGIANTIIYRERMQDAADAIAFSGAVMHARGMNLIALINIIMGLLMAIWMVLRIVQTALLAAIVVCGLGACIPAVPALVAAERIVDQIQNWYANAILRPALRLGHSAQVVIKQAWPVLAQVRVVGSTLGGAYRPPVGGGFLLPVVPRELPIRSVPIRRTCEHGGEWIARLITLPLTFIPGLSALRGTISRFLGAALGQLFCLQDEESIRPHDIDPGSGDCRDGMPGQNCEYVQLRGVVIASRTPFNNNQRGVAVAAWGRAPGGSALSLFQPFTQVGLAQAEYYYEGTDRRDEWTWHMYWRARMRRTRLQGALLGGIPGVGGDLNLIDRMLVH
ncbi:MAG: hypothetical protein HY909_01385 [Deltaproteobacteria bacterium]|nr:hypothetical protein [Deltaproteobacteria bacterium]